MSNYESIPTEIQGRVGIITLNRLKALNALNHKTMEEVGTTAAPFNRGSGIGAIIIVGLKRASTAGADIKGMADRSGTEMYIPDWFFGWNAFTSIYTPVIVVVNGYTFGSGYEVAMIVDSIIAGSGARLDQPEVNLGVTPGMGGS